MVLKNIKMPTLTDIAEQTRTCTKCPLHKYATNAVPGSGNPKARILFIGEAPGKNEDLQGIPFVGAAGKILNELLASIDLKREDIFITNVVKHRPPENREPTPEEAAACRPYLEQQIAIINPEVIVTLGNHALEFINGSKGITSLRGKIITREIAGKIRKIFPTFHPAALIYNRALRPLAEQDFKRIKEELTQKSLSGFEHSVQN